MPKSTLSVVDDLRSESAGAGTKAAGSAAPEVADPLSAVDSASPQQMWLALHELRLRQIELEVQNEELRRVQLAFEAARNRYADLYDAAPVGYLVVGENATIIAANQRAYPSDPAHLELPRCRADSDRLCLRWSSGWIDSDWLRACGLRGCGGGGVAA